MSLSCSGVSSYFSNLCSMLAHTADLVYLTQFCLGLPTLFLPIVGLSAESCFSVTCLRGSLLSVLIICPRS